MQALCVACLLNDVSIHFKRDYRNGKGECHTSTTRAHLLNVISGMCRLHRENQNALLECGILREMHRCLEDDATSLVGLWATEALFFALMNNRSNQDQFKQWPHVHAELIRSSKKENIWGKHFSRNYVGFVGDDVQWECSQLHPFSSSPMTPPSTGQAHVRPHICSCKQGKGQRKR